MDLSLNEIAYDFAVSIIKEYGLDLDGDPDSVIISDKNKFIEELKKALDCVKE